jgi:hypothetical protein
MLAGPPALAESKTTTAEALFAEGRKLMTAGRYGEACPKFEASERLDPGLGTLLNLAHCYEKLGHTASAWASFREAAATARTAGSADREDIARSRAAALEPRLSRLKISLAGNSGGVEVRRDGVLVDSAELGTALPVDPGQHEIVASAPGKVSWSKKVDVPSNASTVELEVPELADPQASPSRATTSSAAEVAAEARPWAQKRSRLPALIAGGVGVVGVGVGTYFGLRARSTFKDAKDHCTDYPFGCGDEGASLSKDASRFGTFSTIGFVVGGVGLAGGVVLWLTSNPKSEGVTALSVGPSQLLASGRF